MRPDRSTSFETFCSRRVVVLHSRQSCSRSKVGSVQEQALDATFIFVKLVDQRLGISPLLLWDVEVHDILGGIFELTELLFETYIVG
jgi:hypothetical protein